MITQRQERKSKASQNLSGVLGKIDTKQYFVRHWFVFTPPEVAFNAIRNWGVAHKALSKDGDISFIHSFSQSFIK